jgi:phospholipid/cholesterol/gamma-HCH transport system substrate-binding protein
MIRLTRIPPKMFGVLVLVLFLLLGWAAFQKEKLATLLTFGHETIAAEFPARAKLIGDDLTYDHTVKLNGVVIGKVTTIERTPRGTMIANMQVDPGTRAKLGSRPTAYLQPTLVTDGVQFLGLRTGGDPNQKFTDDLIPLDRTQMPVALDDVLKSLSSQEAQQGVRAFIGQTDATLRQGGSDAIRNLVTDAPATLQPAGVVLTAFRGSNPDTDLNRFVVGFESFASAINQKIGQFPSTIDGLDRTARALGDGGTAVAEAVRIGPDTLRTTRDGLKDLQPTLHKLKDTSEDFRPSARKLADLLDDFAPVIHRARPVFADLRDVTEDLEPLLRQLPDTADSGNDVLDDVKGPVFDRVNGPIRDRIYAPFKPSPNGEYKNGGVDIPTYKELGYLLSGSSNVWKHYDANTALARLEAGAGGNSVGGTKFPMSVEQYLESFGLQQPPGPNPQGDGPLPALGKPGGRPDPGADVPTLTHSATPDNASIPLLGGSK